MIASVWILVMQKSWKIFKQLSNNFSFCMNLNFKTFEQLEDILNAKLSSVTTHN